MIVTMLLPLGLAVCSVLTARVFEPRVRPATAAPAVAAMAIALACAVTAALAMLAVAVAARSVAWIWCPPTALHDRVPGWLGATAGTVLTIGVARSLLVVRRHQRAKIVGGDHRVLVIDEHEPLAYAQSGRPGRIVISTGMLSCLDDAERHALLAHEQAHLNHGHHRYLLVADLVASAVPALIPLSRWLRFSLERWADEDAADAVGDRTVVARAIGRAALARTDYVASIGLGLARLGVTARVEALQRPLRARPAGVLVVGGLALLAVVVASSAVQIVHLVAFTINAC